MMISPTRSHCWITLLFASVLLLAPYVAQAQASRTVSETIDLDRDGRLRLSAFTGVIDVTTWDRAAVQVDVRIEGDDQKYVDETQIRIDGGGREVHIETDYEALENRFLGLFKTGNADRPATHYTIRMPATAALTLEDFSSEISVTGLRADLTIETFSSPITLQDIEGRIRAETYSSELTIRDLAGGIHLETFSGDVTIAVRALDGDFHFESFSGDVELLLPAETDFDLATELGMSGDVHVDSAFERARAEAATHSGTVSEGGSRIRFETFSGDLTLRAAQ